MPMMTMMMMRESYDQIKIEKEEADLHWEYVFNQFLNGNVDVNMIALAIKRCNEVDIAIFKKIYEDMKNE